MAKERRVGRVGFAIAVVRPIRKAAAHEVAATLVQCRRARGRRQCAVHRARARCGGQPAAGGLVFIKFRRLQA